MDGGLGALLSRPQPLPVALQSISQETPASRTVL